jgi:hypothetical protein
MMNPQFAQNGMLGQPGMQQMMQQNQMQGTQFAELMEHFRKQQSQHMNGWKAELHPSERFGFFREM